MLGQYESVNELKVDDEIELQVVNEKIFVSHNGKQIEEKRTFKKSKHELRCYKLGSDIFAPHYEREFDRFSKISDEFYMIESKRFAVGLHLFFIPYFDRKKSKITLIRYDVVSK